MSEREALLASVLHAPDEDAPRLVFADWLDEHGEAPRADFIRTQLEFHKLESYDPRWGAVATRMRDLLLDYSEEWRLRFVSRCWQRFRRGFVECVGLSAAQFLEHADALFAATPLRELRLRLVANLPEGFTESVHLARLATLDISGEAWPNNLGRLLASRRLAGLRELRLPPIGLQGAAELAAAANMPGLESLHVARHSFGDDGVGLLADATHLSQLRKLHLGTEPHVAHTDRIHAAGAAALAHSPRLTNLSVLNLAGNVIGDGGLTSLAGSRNMAGLTVLNLAGNDIGAIGTAGLEALCESPRLSRLRELVLRGNPLGPAGARVLSEWSGLARLRRLDVGECGFDATGLRLLGHAVGRAFGVRFPQPPGAEFTRALLQECGVDLSL
jgi:uncharacterized protein (TIGR02996 family)